MKTVWIAGSGHFRKWPQETKKRSSATDGVKRQNGQNLQKSLGPVSANGWKTETEIRTGGIRGPKKGFLRNERHRIPFI